MTPAPDLVRAQLQKAGQLSPVAYSERILAWRDLVAAEAAPAGLVSSTTGIIVGSGEIFGGGIAPSVAGGIAQHFGIQTTLTMALVGLCLGAVVCLLLRETAPRKLAGAHQAVRALVPDEE